MYRRAWIVFFILQVIGLSCGLLAEKSNQWGAQMWVIAVVGLMPGNILSGMLVQRLLWNTGVQRLLWNTGTSLQAVSLLRLTVMVLINAILWAFLVYALKSFRRRKEGEHNFR